MSKKKPEQEQIIKKRRKSSYTDEQMDEALKAAYRSGRQQDGVDLLKINKGTFSKKKRKIEENEPERVERLKAEVKAEKKVETQQEQEKVIVKVTTEVPKQEPTVFELIKTTEKASKKPQIAFKLSQTMKNTLKEEKDEKKANMKPQKAVMGFRADINKMEMWKIYADVTEQEIGTFCTAAIDEYINNHELTADQQIVYDLKKKAAEIQRNQK